MKEKRRSNEKRKAKSRDAARSRRGREMDVFTEFSDQLPISYNDKLRLDKASIIRIALAYFRTRKIMNTVAAPSGSLDNLVEKNDFHLKALSGFVLILSSEGDIIYLSSNVKNYLGIAKLDLIGQSVYDYSHPCDHEDLKSYFLSKSSKPGFENYCDFFLRLKCTMTTKGRKVNLKSASYKVVHCTGRIIHDAERKSKPLSASNCSKPSQEVTMVVVASPVPHPSNIEMPLGTHTFFSKHSLNMKFTYADEKLADFLGWESRELVGQSVFQFYHALDNESLNKSFKSLFVKGQCETSAYRFLCKTGGYAWVTTQAAIIQCSRKLKPLSVVCIHYILSGIECKGEIYSEHQLKLGKSESVEIIEPSAKQFKTENHGKHDEISSALVNHVKRPYIDVDLDNTPRNEFKKSMISTSHLPMNKKPCRSATASIFAPRTKDMNKGFLTFSDDQSELTILKDEPEDLTHLAPTAGDVCVPLDESTILWSSESHKMNSYEPRSNKHFKPDPFYELSDYTGINDKQFLEKTMYASAQSDTLNSDLFLSQQETDIFV